MQISNFPNSGLEYLAEGGANVVYNITSPFTFTEVQSEAVPKDEAPDTITPLPTEGPMLDSNSLSQKKLVRLRKELPTAVTVVDAQHNYDLYIKPYFQDDELVEQTLTLFPLAIFQRCNRNLHKMESEGTRPKKRQGEYLRVTDLFGTMITDMSPQKNEDVISFEFKPKWLVQSPSAPIGAKRCRTCALRAMRSAQQQASSVVRSTDSSQYDFCPLGLVSKNEETIETTLRSLVRGYWDLEPETLDRVIKFLYRHPIIQKLKDLQARLDPKGIFATNIISSDYLTAMTLRDCTLFVKVSLRALLNLALLH